MYTVCLPEYCVNQILLAHVHMQSKHADSVTHMQIRRSRL